MIPVPHIKIVVGFCVVAMSIYAGFSIYIVAVSKDAALTGDVIGTWKSFAVAVMAFWVGSSSAGKAASGGPIPTTVVNDQQNPVPTTDTHNDPKPAKPDDPDA